MERVLLWITIRGQREDHHSCTNQSLDGSCASVLSKLLLEWHYWWDELLLPYHWLSLEDGHVMWGSWVVIPEVGHQKVFKSYMWATLGHPGWKVLPARGLVWWPEIDSDIENQDWAWVDCEKNHKSPVVASLHLWEWPAHPWEHPHIDYTGPVLRKTFPVPRWQIPIQIHLS